MKEIIDDKRKLEKDILSLLQKFEEKYPGLIISKINVENVIERSMESEIIFSKVTNVIIQIYV